MYTVLTVIHVVISAALIMVILGQSSKGGALDGLVGGTASSMFGSQGASNFLKNATKILAFLFMLSCFFLAFQMKSNRGPASSKVVDKLKEETAEEQTQEEELPELPPLEETAPNNSDQ